jgi:hypothetical protein
VHPVPRPAVPIRDGEEENSAMDLGNIRPAMDVVGSDGERLGTVDHVDRNRIKLRRDDPASRGEHHWLAQDMISEVDGDTVRLAVPASQARRSWQGEAGAQRSG